MTAPEIAWPKKTREIKTIGMDSARWNGFPFRDDDIIIATYMKSGTTWMQQIVSQFIFHGVEGISLDHVSPWLECILPLYPPDVVQTLEAQTHRRFIKTHLPLDCLVFSCRAKYIYVARDGRDALWSIHNQVMSMKGEIRAAMRAAGGQALPETPVELFRFWLESGTAIFGDFWSHQQQWWDARVLPNVLLVHYNNLKADLPGEMRRVADFLGIEIEEQLWPVLVEHCTFDYMKKNGSALVPMTGAYFERGAENFIHKGTNGRWRDELNKEDIEKYERLADERLTPDCAHWLATGELRSGAPA